MNNTVRVLLWIFVIISITLFLAVSYDNTRQMASNFHADWDTAPWLFAAAAELGVVGCTAGRILRERAGLDARNFTRTLVAVLAISVTANLLAGADAFAPEWHVLDAIRTRPPLAWLLVAAFGALIPLLTLSFTELLATLVAEGTQSAGMAAQVRAPGELRARIIELYREQPSLPPVDVARMLNCSPSTVRRARARVQMIEQEPREE